ncbi:MAG: dihydroorotase [Bacteroidaceae bacterium]|nr:dihydroorotase [Bacteroidaceae bacterium]
MKRLLTNALIVNEGTCVRGSLLIDGEVIGGLYPEGAVLPTADATEDLQGALLLPGVIDDHVHFRDPGLTHKADIASESRAALAGGVTSVMDMPNVVPQTTTIARWEERMKLGAQECRVNFAYYLGATNDNIDEILRLDCHRVPAVKLFMGSSTGDMLVDKENALRQLFRQCPTLIMAHCEYTVRTNRRMREAKALYGDDPDVSCHPWIRDVEACYLSSEQAVRLATEEHARLHLAHITTAKELTLLPAEGVTAEVCIPHLIFTEADYRTKGTRIKCNPAVKSAADRDALRKALTDGRIHVIGTDHAPHLLREKEGGAAKAVSGMPMLQFSLPTMLELVDEGVLTLEQMVALMSHNPASLFGIERRGYLREGYQADLTIVEKRDWTLRPDDILSKCGWSPLEGYHFTYRVRDTYINGRRAYHDGKVDDDCRGQALTFRT